VLLKRWPRGVEEKRERSYPAREEGGQAGSADEEGRVPRTAEQPSKPFGPGGADFPSRCRLLDQAGT